MSNNFLRGVFGAVIISSAVLTSACGTATSPAGATDATAVPSGQTSGSTNATTTTTPTPTTTTTTASSAVEPIVSPNGIHGEFDVADNFDVQSTLAPTLETVGVAGDPVGAFRFTCLSGQVSHDDPIVYPGQPGKSHLHQFFGNMLTNANSTYQSLRTTGGSTCTRNANSTDPSPQRSAYWQPAMLDGAGNVVKPDYMLTYYKNFPNGNPECKGPPDATHLGWCIPMPNGMRMISGVNMDVPGDSTLNPNSGGWGAIQFECIASDTHTTLSGYQHSIADVLATGKCNVPGAILRIAVSFPNCWDGKNLDVADHRSHVVYGNGTIIDNYAAACPADHPYLIPVMSIQTFFTLDANFFAGKWHLSSDEMVPGYVAGQTMHADYLEAWSPVVKNDWNTGCINGHFSCNVGEMGTGQSVKGMSQDVPYPVHILVALASILV